MRTINVFSLEYQLASPKKQRAVRISQIRSIKEAQELSCELNDGLPVACNDAGFCGDSLVDNRMHRAWQVLATKLWDHLFKTGQYDALVEEMGNPILSPMNHRILFG